MMVPTKETKKVLDILKNIMQKRLFCLGRENKKKRKIIRRIKKKGMNSEIILFHINECGLKQENLLEKIFKSVTMN